MALSVSIHIHFPPTWLFHGISIKLGAHRPHMWGSSKHTSTFSHLSSGMCGSPSDCCGHVCVQARHREVGYIAGLLVTYGTAVWVGGACNIHDPWSFVDVFPHFEKYTGVKSGLCANYLTAASELRFCGGLFVFAPSASLNAKKNENKKKQTSEAVKAAPSDRCQSEAKNCSLPGICPASPDAQSDYSPIYQLHSNHHLNKRKLWGKTSDPLNMAGSCLSLLLCNSCSRPSLLFFSRHCVATNTPFWQWLNCAETLKRAELIIATPCRE